MALAVGTDLPAVEVVYEALSYSVSTGAAEAAGPPNTLQFFGHLATAPVRAATSRKNGRTNTLDVIKNVSGRLRPGTATMILASAGGGSSALMRMFCGRQTPTGGSLLWNGRTSAQLCTEGVSLRKLTAFGPVEDDNEALLTVYETLDFAYKCAVVPVAAQTASSAADSTADGNTYYTPLTAELMTKRLGLEESRDTIIGNALMRGVSGGQKRRVTVGEALIQNARITCLDGPTNGLDAVTATEVCSFAVDVARRTGGILVATLAAPLPETASLFDDVILLAEGRVLYHGPYSRMDEYFSSLGFERPSYMDSASWANEIISSPLNAALLLIEDCKKKHAGAMNGEASEISPEPCIALLGKLSSLSIETLADVWDQSPWKSAMMAGRAPPFPSFPSKPPQGRLANRSPHSAVASTVLGPSNPLLGTPYAQAQYGLEPATGFRRQVALTTGRELTLMRRNWLYTSARLANAVGMGAILGLVFLQLELSEWFLFYSCSLFAFTFVSFLNNSIVPIAMQSRLVVYKQTSAGLYSEKAYNLAVLAGHLPISILADFLFATVLYWIVGFAPDVARWLFFCLLVLLMDLAISVLYRSFSYATPNQELAMIVSSLFTAIGLSTGGFFVVRSQVPAYLIWLLYISPFFWSVNSAANNEFSSSRYTEAQGDAFMSAFAYLNGTLWKWFGALVLLLYYLFFGLVVQPLILKRVRYEIPRGTKRLPIESNAEAERIVKNALSKTEAMQAGRKAEAAAISVEADPVRQARIPFTPVTLTFRDITYSVQIKPNNKGRQQGNGAPPKVVDKLLLRGVSGFARPGDLMRRQWRGKNDSS